MEKYIFPFLFLLVSFEVYAMPSGYTLLTPQPSQGVNVYSGKTGKITTVIEALPSNSVIDFGLVKPGTSKSSIKSYWDSYFNYKTVAIINAQFFNMNNGKLSFATKANSSVLEQKGNESWTYKSFARYSDTNVSIFNGYSQYDFNLSRDYIQGLHPLQDLKNSELLVPRTFMAVKRQHCFNGNKCPVSAYYFFIDSGFKQSQMVSAIREWGILESDIVMLDGGGSTQMCGKYSSFNCNYNSRPVPHAIKISIK